MHRIRSYTFVAASVLLLTPCFPVHSEDMYKWTDESGGIHFSDSLAKVPQKYREQLERKGYEEAPPRQLEPNDSTPRPRSSAVDNKSDAKHPTKYEVPYMPYEGSAKRVIVTAVFNGSVSAPLAIDTGAPGTVISYGLAKRIGLLDEDQGKLQVVIGGIGGTAPAIRSIIDTVQVGGAKSEFVPTTISAPISNAFDGLLGLDFVANYTVTIDTKRKVVVFEELPSDPELPGGHDRDWWSSLFREFAESKARWKSYSEDLDKRISASMRSIDNKDIGTKAFAEQQYREADKLFDKLNRYAREHSVPMHWKQY